MRLAGALERVLVVHMDEHRLSSPPCQCLECVKDEFHVHMDRGGRAYCLMDKAVDGTKNLVRNLEILRMFFVLFCLLFNVVLSNIPVIDYLLLLYINILCLIE